MTSHTRRRLLFPGYRIASGLRRKRAARRQNGQEQRSRPMQDSIRLRFHVLYSWLK
jgi:hypothetical protein